MFVRAVPDPWVEASDNRACFCLSPLGSLVSAPGHEFCIQFANWNHLVTASSAGASFGTLQICDDSFSKKKKERRQIVIKAHRFRCHNALHADNTFPKPLSLDC